MSSPETSAPPSLIGTFIISHSFGRTGSYSFGAPPGTTYPRTGGALRYLRRLPKLVKAIFTTIVADVRHGLHFLSHRNDELSTLENTLRDDGFVVIEGHVPQSDCDNLRASVEQLVADYDRDRAGSRVELEGGAVIEYRDSHDGKQRYDTGMIDILHVDAALPEMARFKDDPVVRNIINKAAASTMKVKNVNAYVNRSVTTTRDFHCDSLATEQYKAFVYLNDVDDLDTGPYAFVRGTHRASFSRYLNIILDFVRGRPLTDMRRGRTDRTINFLAPRGTLIITNQRGWHRGIPQAPGSLRVVAVANYVTS